MYKVWDSLHVLDKLRKTIRLLICFYGIPIIIFSFISVGEQTMVTRSFKVHEMCFKNILEDDYSLFCFVPQYHTIYENGEKKMKSEIQSIKL